MLPGRASVSPPARWLSFTRTHTHLSGSHSSFCSGPKRPFQCVFWELGCVGQPQHPPVPFGDAAGAWACRMREPSAGGENSAGSAPWQKRGHSWCLAPVWNKMRWKTSRQPPGGHRSACRGLEEGRILMPSIAKCLAPWGKSPTGRSGTA